MSPINQPKSSRPNRRSGLRRPLQSSIRVECRKGSTGLGPNLTQAFLDLSQSGIRLVVRSPFRKGEEAEVLIVGNGIHPLKRIADVAWSVPTEDGYYVVGLHFHRALSYAEVQGIARP
jgi:PilZ domain-containing protein